MKLIEMRLYTIKPGMGAEFHRLVSYESAPLLRESGMDVIAFGQSLHDPDAYFLFRAYNDLAHREASQASFYGSAAWRDGPREAVVSLIVSDANTVFWLDQDTTDQLRNAHGLTA